MSFLKDLKADWSQAVNELLPEDELLEGLEDSQEEDKEIEEPEIKLGGDKEEPLLPSGELSLEDEFFKALDQLDSTETDFPEFQEEEPEMTVDVPEELGEAADFPDKPEAAKDVPEEMKAVEKAPEEQETADEKVEEETDDERELREIEEMIRQEEEEKRAMELKLAEEMQLAEEMKVAEAKKEEEKRAEEERIAQEELKKESEEDTKMAENDEIYEDTNVEKGLLDQLMEEEMGQKADMEEPEASAGAAVENTTIITKGTVINGSISSDGSLEVMGTITGDIECLGKLSIVGKVSGSSTASEIYVDTSRLEGNLNSRGSVKVGVGTIVVGDISGTSAVIAGAVKGEVDVPGPVIVDSTAIVKGNIKAKSVQINNGAVLDGYCSLAYSDVDLDNFFSGDK